VDAARYDAQENGNMTMKTEQDIKKEIEKIKKDVYTYAEKWSDDYIKANKEKVRTLEWVLGKREKVK